LRVYVVIDKLLRFSKITIFSIIAVGYEHDRLIGIKPPRDHGGSFVFAFDQDQVVVYIHAFASFLGYGIIIANLGGGVKGKMKRHASRGRCVP
jgi:hypothetical protein